MLLLALTAGAAWGADALLWFDAAGPTSEARQAVDILMAAADHGLDPRDYGANELDRRLRQALQGPALGAAEQAQLDSQLTAAMTLYLADLQDGRVDPRQIHADFDVPRHAPFDTLAFIREAATAHRVIEAFQAAQPHLPMYASLRESLARYRALADHPAWQAALPPLPGKKLAPGQAYAGLPLLARRLEALGDLPAGTALPERFQGVLVTALREFQERHGLKPDGVLGQATLQQLNVPPAARVRQIELALERLRWTPFLRAPRMIAVNVPEFVLRAYEVRDGQVHVNLSMKVIVGKALDTRTPLIDEDMRFIEFSPYWNVPPSIARKEVVPRLRRDPAYFQREGFEFVTAGGRVVTELTTANLEAVLHAGWRIRQRPGPRNALGDIKFVFPNQENIYLHHTPAPQLFERERRDFSHGCIRVQDPVALAKFVLQDDPAWTEGRIREAMGKGESNTIRLDQPVPVLIAYNTVVAKGGRVFFYPDLYGHDRLLDTALRERSAVLTLLRRPSADAK
jgi:murein L,D-transpeptidase YcbB/YkuD